MVSESTKQALERELERAYPGPVTGRSLVSLVADDSRETAETALSELVVEGRVERRRKKGMTSYRLANGPRVRL
ncbi:hypothetical protein [Haladaptatus caseinilyticus]|uniref:hypothetical protein n=1 Tax=Haladaptatus caseinilyticus TaxID=2993314 RepID=UPI00224AA0DA|nr:hypothetical protein [Haladaptatus caseinilyticus]